VKISQKHNYMFLTNFHLTSIQEQSPVLASNLYQPWYTFTFCFYILPLTPRHYQRLLKKWICWKVWILILLH